MLKLKFILPAVLIVLAGCSQKVHNSASGVPKGNKSDSLYMVMAINNEITEGEPVNLKFVVHNDQKMEKSFCKWHTPFEPLMSKYLTIIDNEGNEVGYKGPMAKRIMPPPADSYLVVNAKDTISAQVDLLKAYQLVAGKKYKISYNSSGMSGLVPGNSVSFTYKK